MIINFRIFPKKYAALSVWPFIFISSEGYRENKVLINHEKIHLRQQIELLWIPFFTWYVLEFLVKLIIYKKWDLAYRAISFEREAYQNESNPDYLQQRKLWSFWKHL